MLNEDDDDFGRQKEITYTVNTHADGNFLIQRDQDHFIVHGISTRDSGDFWFQAKGQGESFMDRVLGAMLLDAMPDSGLEETKENLIELFKFYAFEPQRTLPPPSVEDISLQIVAPLD